MPLNLIKFLLSLKEHWYEISPQQLFKSPQNQLDCLICFFKELRQTAPEISFSWNELYSFLKYCTEIINALPYDYYHITDVLLNDLMKASKFLKEKLDPNIMPDDELLSIVLSNNLNVSNDDDDGSKIENILMNILSKVNTFCTEFYQTNGFTRNLPGKKDYYPIILSKSIPYYKQIEDYCQKLSNIIKVMSRIKIMGFEQILESRIIINEFLKAIIELDEKVQLSPTHVTNYVLMKDKYLFLNVLIFFQNNLAAMKNMVTTSKL